MKIIKYKKYQKGGGLPPLFVDYNPVLVNDQAPNPLLAYLSGVSSARTSSSSSSKSGSDGLPSIKDTLALLKDMKGLDNDYLAAMQSIKQSQQEAALFGNSASVVSDYYRNLELVNKVIESKEQYKLAYDQAKAQSALASPAITATGEVVVKDANNVLKPISVEEYTANKDKYSIQTNSQLLSIRQTDPNMAFNNSVLHIVQNSTSFKQVQEVINSIADKLGTTTVSVTDNTQKQVAEGVNALRANVSSKSVNSDVQAQYALDAIYRNLNEAQKSLLKLNGNGTDEGAKAVIKEILISKTSSTKEVTYDTPKVVSENGSNSKSSNGTSLKSKIKLDNAAKFFLGYGERFTDTIHGPSNKAITIKVNELPITDSAGKTIMNGTLTDLAERFGGQLNIKDAVMGNAHINPLAAGNIVVVGDKIRSTELPVDANGNPDLTLADKIAEIEKDLGINSDFEKLSDEDKKRINQQLQKERLPIKFDEKGNLAARYKRFAMVKGITSEINFANKEIPLMGAEKSNDQDRNLYKQILQKNAGDKGTVEGVSDGINVFGTRYFGNEIYTGTIFIPMNTDITTALQNSDQTASELGELLVLQRYNKPDNGLLE